MDRDVWADVPREVTELSLEGRFSGSVLVTQGGLLEPGDRVVDQVPVEPRPRAHSDGMPRHLPDADLGLVVLCNEEDTLGPVWNLLLGAAAA